MIKLDDLDLKILTALQREGRMTKVKLAETVNLSVSPCWERLKRLEREGVISGFHADVDIDKLVKVTQVWVEISLGHHQQQDFTRFEAYVQDVEDIVECWATGGTIDYLLRVVTPDLETYQALIDRLLNADIGIDRYVTCVVTKQVKKSDGLPLHNLLGTRKN